MKVGILTFHRAINNGAFLQCYSLQKEICKRHPDWDVEIIDFESGNMKRYYEHSVISYFFGPYNTINNHTIFQRSKRLAARMIQITKGRYSLKKYIKENKKNRRFHQLLEYLPLTDSSCFSDDYNNAINFINDYRFDIIIVGSDAIWNDYQTNIPNVFYLNDSINARKLSYAASCYGMMRDITKDDAYKRRALMTYEYIGVRDYETENYVRSLSSEVVIYHNCDPTLLLDLDSLPISIDRLRNRIADLGFDLNEPIIGVMGDSEVGKIARSVCGHNAQLLGLFFENDYCNHCLIDINPFEWACIFSFFKVTFTSFFHGTIFSLKNGVPTITIERNVRYAEKHYTKTQDLLSRLLLKDYYFTANSSIGDMARQFQYYLDNNQKDRILNGLKREVSSSESFFECLGNKGC